VRSLELSLDKYHPEDKIGYLKEYDPIFEPYVQKKITLLELGILKGESLLLWRDYFPFGVIAGIDIKLPRDFDPGERIHIFEGSQADPQFLSNVANKVAPDGFDIIIDDASHIGELTKTAFWHLFDNHLKPNGLYVIEDWGTGYWSDWPDGKKLNLESYTQQKFQRDLVSFAQQKFRRSPFWMFLLEATGKLGLRFPMRSHCYGMAGFIKQLIDEQAAADVTRGMEKGKPTRGSKFERMIVTSSLVFVKKASTVNVEPSDLDVDNGQ
jgi:hypothetical protein